MRTLRKGDTGAEVRKLHKLLRELGYLDANSTKTAVFDNETRQAVMGFQARHLDSRGHPLVADGIVGQMTWDSLTRPKDKTGRRILRPMAPGGSKRGRAALLIARREYVAGAHEIGANNSGKWVKKYLNGLAPTPNNWCAAFVSHCFEMSGPMPFNYSLGAKNIRNQLKRKGMIYVPADGIEPGPGDIIFWWRGQPKGWQGHIGFVERTEAGILTTMEGNKGRFPAYVNQFDYVQGRIDKLLGFARIPD